MTRWEYCYVAPYDDEACFLTPDGERRVDIERDTIRGFIAQLGIEGWEMTGVENHISGTTRLWFKRPLPHD
jgi:hypothetical protein